MARGLLSDRRELISLFDERAEELADADGVTELVMVGGSWMLWHGRRAATRDVDSGRRFGTDVNAASSGWARATT